LLDVTRISQGQAVIKKQRLDLDGLIAETVEELQVTTNIRLVITEHLPLPIIWGDRERLEQVLTNLLANAIKYAPEAREVFIHADSEPGKVTISIQDFGAGMSVESLRKIFDRYYRLEEPATGRHPGVGLGLYIASEIIRRHGGEIKVSSQKDKGSVFTVTLPVD
ncbi:MAG TPA: ATP-binding protein, partial [Puia sp.]|nr:ATP-binding protein [Puia sp.]